MKKAALVLSGGGSRGAYEIGVWKALKKLNIKINMVFGTSVGSINGALIAQNDIKLAENLWQKLETDMIFDVDSTGTPAEDAIAYAKEIVLHGGAGSSGLSELLHQYIDEKKIKRSSTEYGIVTTEFPSFDVHYMYKENIPDGQLIDYIMASASCFPAAQKYTIGDKQFIDGGYKDNLPVAMALDKGAKNIIAVDLQAVGIVKSSDMKKAEELTDEFHIIKSDFDLGNFLIFDTLNTTKIMTLGYLDTLRHFKKYDGRRYTFKKSVFTSHELLGADNLAYFLKLDPCEIYTKKTFFDAAKTHIKKLKEAAEKTTDFSISKDIKPSDIKSTIENIKTLIADAALRIQLVFYIAESLKEKESESIFLQPGLFKVLEEEIQAANFIIQNKLL